jgi:hypothetical protein
VFIDNPTIPTQLEVLVDLLYAIRHKNASSESVKSLLQPKGLPDLSASSNQAALHLNGAKELRLAAEDDAGQLRLTFTIRDGKPSAREAIVKAFDDVVLSCPDVEPWFGRLYGFAIAQEDDWIPSDSASRKDLCTRFNEALPGHIERANPLNDTKLSHYLRWYPYAGMGWRDPAKRFIPDPTERLRRAVPKIFGEATRLDAGPFMSAVALACPELDGGALFMDAAASSFDPAARVCTRALAVALRNLHDEEVVRLECPKDSIGWSLERGGSVRDQQTLQSDRFDRVVLLPNRKAEV